MFSHSLDEQSTLRLLEPHQADAMFALVDANRAHLREWLAWLDVNTSPRDSRAYIEMTRKQWASNNGFAAGIWHRGQLAGVIDFHGLNWSNRSACLGYWLGKDFEGHGLMTRATRALIDHAFREWKLNRVEIRCAVENVKSRAIPERLGFSLEGTHRDSEWLYDHFVDHAVYAMLARDWPEAH